MSRQTRRKRCMSCNVLFEPDLRTKGRQKYCSKPECQTIRQRKNEKDWRQRNPDCVEYQRLQTRQWFKAHPEYNRYRRKQNPQLAESNRNNSRMRMEKIRKKRMFDKSKVILSQLSGNKEVRCYLTKDNQWLYLRLTKASPLSKLGFRRDNSNNLAKPKWLYKISDKTVYEPALNPKFAIDTIDACNSLKTL